MTKNFKRIGVVGTVAVTLAPLCMASATWAWGPERPTYTMQAPADHATFNSITDNALVGDERDFVRIVEKGVGNTYTSELTIEPGKQYEVYIYYHNDASETFNDTAHHQVGVAKETRVITDFPDELAKNERQAIIGKITSTTATPATVWDEAYVTAKEAMTLHYVEGSAKIYNKWNQDGTLLSTRIFDPSGTYIGLEKLNGIIFGCDQYSGSISYTIQTVAKGAPEPTPDPEPEPGPAPEDPTPEPTPDEPTPEKPETPEVPNELPHTGPLEIILAVVVIGMIIAGIVYWNKTRKAVTKASKKAKGRK